MQLFVQFKFSWVQERRLHVGILICAESFLSCHKVGKSRGGKMVPEAAD